MTPSNFVSGISSQSAPASGVVMLALAMLFPLCATADIKATDYGAAIAVGEQAELKREFPSGDQCYVVENGREDFTILAPNRVQKEWTHFFANVPKGIGYWECKSDAATPKPGTRIYPETKSTFSSLGVMFGTGTGLSPDGSRLYALAGYSENENKLYAYELEEGEDGEYSYHLKAITKVPRGGLMTSISDDGSRIAFTGTHFMVYSWDGSNFTREMLHKTGSDWYSNTFGLFRMRPDGEFAIGFYVKNSKFNREPYFYSREGGSWTKSKGSSFPYTLSSIPSSKYRVYSVLNQYSPFIWLPDNKVMIPVWHGPTMLSTIDIMSYDPKDPNSLQVVDQIKGLGSEIDMETEFCKYRLIYTFCSAVESMAISPNQKYLAISMGDGQHIYIYEDIDGKWTRIGVSDPAYRYTLQDQYFFNSLPIAYNSNLAITDDADVFAISYDRGSTYQFRDLDGDGVWDLYKDLKPNLDVEGEYPLVTESVTPGYIAQDRIAVPENAAFLIRSDVLDQGHSDIGGPYHGSIYIQSLE